MRKLRKKIVTLLKDRKGNMMPLVVAVTICMLIIILGVAEYMRLVITAAGIKDAMESAVISTVNDNYNEVYHSVREGYAAGYEPDGESFSASADRGKPACGKFSGRNGGQEGWHDKKSPGSDRDRSSRDIFSVTIFQRRDSNERFSYR